jgi:hypothetical protein
MAVCLGVDFDNTLICYDEVFHRVAMEQGLVPPDTLRTKEAVRGYLRAAGREDAWTELQGHVYGSRLREAHPFPGALAFLAQALRRGIPVAIISHKTRNPYRGPAVDLHAAAMDWLAGQGCFDPARIGLARDRVFFRETKEAKIEQIAAVGCSHFIDDLPEILLAERFPGSTEKLLFAPAGSPALASGSALTCMSSWAQIQAHFVALWEARR